ncbi:hypothetical protein N7490_011708 [Penicillium lividum]|nr:hypothetical protein N7490_011708 [Penicillium lividum]
MGRHTSTIPLDRQGTFFKLVFAFEPLYITTAGVIKLSVLLMYYRVFPVRYSPLLGVPRSPKHKIPRSQVIALVLKGHSLAMVYQTSSAFEADMGSTSKFVAACISHCRIFDRKLVCAIRSFNPENTLKCLLIKNSVVFASIYRFSLIFIFDMNDIAWTLADAQTWCVVELAAGVISACLTTTAPLIRICTNRLVFTAKSITMSNLTQSEKRVLSRTRVTTHSINAENTFNASTDDERRASNEDYVSEEMNPGHRGSSHMKGKGWTVISAEHDSD